MIGIDTSHADVDKKASVAANVDADVNADADVDTGIADMISSCTNMY